MVASWRRLTDLPGDRGEARMWIFGLARWTLRNHSRGERRRVALAEKVRTHLIPPAIASPAADDGQEVRDALFGLKPELREIVELVHWDGFTLTQTAQVIGIPAPTARGRYARAKDDLRVALGVIV